MKRVGVSELRKMTTRYLRELKEPLEICHKNQPLRVLVPFGFYMKLQELYKAATGRDRKEPRP